MSENEFSLDQFLPYALNKAAEATSVGFQKNYRQKYGMLRTEWRVLFHLGNYGPMTAKMICERASLHKTKVSRAVSALEKKRYLLRETQPEDRRLEVLSLTKLGAGVYADLYQAAKAYDAALEAHLTAEEREVLNRCLEKITKL
ncbi:MarR family winged helix-turn-helix transcriptional regulator [Sulfitobacter donghicola]|uniref:MarR family transcriptional regulator n=1 Tax=Sulfitobacter donghicola DSW-25 = KCTC 12864 = JCM 14565 TaxID=1300350 RepID=A0A073IEE1_9RHOB|nr:MarR family transcriptional regulator [Sulfitobacter donghicola]KEJ88728.1 MarR family transcriptional regulator [Sulfitobacter donghicola DSW-25 = KCTC 12864 = JCM 14565]KIN68510.1 Transcriptional regulator, MarR family protein [Sulfitobacter donghicola DSW-25 = KCTC 12864 = JCM 14565]